MQTGLLLASVLERYDYPLRAGVFPERAVRAHDSAPLVVALHIVAVVHILRERHPSAVVRQVCVQTDAELRRKNEQPREQEHQHTVPFRLALVHDDMAAVVNVPRQLACRARLIALIQPVPAPDGNIPAHAPGEYLPGAAEAGTDGELFAVRRAYLHAEQPFSGRCPPEMQQKRLDDDHEHRADYGAQHLQHDIQFADIEPQPPLRYETPQETVQREIEIPREVPPPRAAGRRRSSRSISSAKFVSIVLICIPPAFIFLSIPEEQAERYGISAQMNAAVFS